MRGIGGVSEEEHVVVFIAPCDGKTGGVISLDAVLMMMWMVVMVMVMMKKRSGGGGDEMMIVSMELC